MHATLKAIVLAVATTVSAGAMAEDMKMGAMDKAAPKSAAGSSSSEAYQASMEKMMADMKVNPTGNADKDFVMMMMPHHQGAIDMAKVELRYGKDPELRKMAEDIVKAQEKEIGEMKAWQAKAGR